MEPDMNSVVQKLLQKNATLTLVNVQLESLVEQYQAKEADKAEEK